MIVRERKVWRNHVQTHARAYPREKTKVSENKAKRENENKTNGIKWRDIRSWKKHLNRLKCGLECWKEKKEMKKKIQRKTTWQNFARVASGIVFCGGVLVTKLPGTHLTIGRPSRIPWGYPSLYSTIYFEQLQLNQRLLCNGNWEGAISAVKIYSFFDWRAVFFFQLVYSPVQARVSQNFQRVFAPGKCFFLSIFNYLIWIL